MKLLMTSNWTYFLKKKEELEIDSGIVVLLFNFCLCIFIENQDCLHHWVPPCVQQGLGFKDFWKGGSFSAFPWANVDSNLGQAVLNNTWKHQILT